MVETSVSIKIELSEGLLARPNLDGLPFTRGSVVDDLADQLAEAPGGVVVAALYPDGGDHWVSFTLFREDWPEVDLEFWARKAYVAPP